MNISKKIIKRVENDLKPHNVETIKNILEIYKTSFSHQIERLLNRLRRE